MKLRLLVAGVGCVLGLAGCGGTYAHLPPPRLPDDEEPVSAPAPKDLAGHAAGAVGKPTESGVPARPPEQPPASEHSALIKTTPSQPTTAPPPAAVAGGLSEVDRRSRVINQLTKIGRALEQYRERTGSYAGRTFGPTGNLSWRVGILPALGYRDLFNKFHLQEPWDSPHNLSLLGEIPNEFKASERQDTKTRIVCLSGPQAPFGIGGDQEISDATCTDGLANSILVLEVDDGCAVPWTAPQDFVLDPARAHQDLFGARRDCCFALFGAPTGLRRIEADIADDHLLALTTGSGGEPVTAASVTSGPHPQVNHELLERISSQPVVRFAKAAAATAAREPAATVAADLEPTTQGPVTTTVAPAGGTIGDVGPRGITRPTDGRLPPPDEAALSRAADLIRDVYSEEYRAAKTATERRTFAKKLLDEARKMSADPTGMFVLCRAAREIGIETGDVQLAFRAIDQIARAFRIAEAEMRSESLQNAARHVSGESEREFLFEQSLELGDQALAQDDFDRAKLLFGLAEEAARKAKKQDWLSRSNQRQDDLSSARRAYQRVSDQVHALVRNPDDPAANAAVGRYLCLTKREWPRGLEMLVRGADEPLRLLGEAEHRSPTKAEEQVQLADQWWDWSQAARDALERESARQRAAHWYRLALGSLPDSLRKVQIEKRLRETSAEPASTALRSELSE